MVSVHRVGVAKSKKSLVKKNIGLGEQQRLSVEILSYIDTICKKNAITYFLGYGTALGAVRHGGFIPWDDDIDIVMPRPAYDRFLALFEKEKHPFYKIHAIETEDTWLFFYAKVCDERTVGHNNVHIVTPAIAVDVFPLDGYPNEIARSNRFVREMRLLQKIRYIQIENVRMLATSFIKRILIHIAQLLLKLYPARKLSAYFVSRMKENDYSTSNYAGLVLGNYGKREKMRKALFTQPISIVFEGKKYPIVAAYDEYLTNLYGDYMTLPPVEKRISHHNISYHWK
jgi:lipopolysaccharide cholinephosphotransferase